METDIFTPLQMREIFHLEFLRWFGRSVKPAQYSVKGGVNIRFFFGSVRYSEDMDLDASGISLDFLKDAVMRILQSRSFIESLQPFGVRSLVAPDMLKAKQTEVTQRFKIHLTAASGEDLYTKVEFSRRGFSGTAEVSPVPGHILRPYKLPSLLVPHYEVRSALLQKINALANRKVVQARDIFDLYVLRPQAGEIPHGSFKAVGGEALDEAKSRVYDVDFNLFRDTVVEYLAPGDREVYGNPQAWEQVRLNVIQFLEEAEQHG